MADNSNLAAALEYAARGWYVFPCKADKKPHTEHGFKDASAEARQISAWWQKWPGALVGIACGASGLLVIDLDVKGGFDGIANFEALAIEHTEALHSQTPSGGMHIVWRDSSAGAVRNSVSYLAPGVDVRAAGGYIIAPPSAINGSAYTALDDWKREPALAPQELLAELVKAVAADRRPVWKSTMELLETRRAKPAPLQTGIKSRYAEAALESELDAVRLAPPGSRNETLNRAAFALAQLVAGGELAAAMTQERLIEACASNGLVADDGERAVLATIESAFRAGATRPRARPEPPEPPEHYDRRASEAPKPAPDDAETVPDLLECGADDEGNAQAVALLHAGKFQHTEALGWLAWQDTHWSSTNARAIVQRAIVGTLLERRKQAVDAEREALVKTTRATSARVTSAEFLLTSLLRSDVADFDGEPDLLNCQNGVVDLRTGALLAHSPDQRFTYCAGAPYMPHANQRPWRDFLAQALDGNAELLEYLQEAVGYSLTGHTREEVMFYIHGPARAGKGTFTETILAALGYRPLAEEADFATFTAERTGDVQNFDLAALKPCRFVAASESQKTGALNAAKIKALTGGNLVRCAHKYKDFFSYRPQFKIWLSSNHPVNVDVDDEAAWTRLRVIAFPVSWVGREDKLLKARLLAPENLAGALAWAIEGAQRWYSRARGLETPDAVRMATQQAREELDFIKQWLEECAEITGNDADFTPYAELHTSYRDFCMENGITPKQLRAFTQALQARGAITGAQRWHAGRNKKGAAGIRLTL